jgi:hypothetical protein
MRKIRPRRSALETDLDVAAFAPDAKPGLAYLWVPLREAGNTLFSLNSGANPPIIHNDAFFNSSSTKWINLSSQK